MTRSSTQDHVRRNRAGCVLVTGFGPFPGAAFNPSAPLVRRLARRRRPALSRALVVDHVFATAYSAVDRELPRLLERHRPDVVLMFGVAPRAKTLRIETHARNAIAAFPDALRMSPRARTIADKQPSRAKGRAPFARMLRTARQIAPAATLSRNAGRYLCNYVYWRALELSAQPDGPKVVAFIHIPRVPDIPRRRRRGGRRPASLPHLLRAAEAILAVAMSAASRAACTGGRKH